MSDTGVFGPPYTLPENRQTNRHVQGLLLGQDNVIVAGGHIRSADYVEGVSGLFIGPDTVEFNDGTFRGAIEGATIDIGGADATSFHVDAAGNLWAGASTFAAAPFKVSAAGALTASGATISGSVAIPSIDIGGMDSTSFHVDTAGNLWLGASSFFAAPFRVGALGDLEVTGADITGGAITGGTITGSLFRTAVSGARVEIDTSDTDRIKFYDAGALGMSLGRIGGQTRLATSGALFVTNLAGTGATVDAGGFVTAFSQVVVSGANVTAQGTVTGGAGSFNSLQLWALTGATVVPIGINGPQVYYDSSSLRFKRDIVDAGDEWDSDAFFAQLRPIAYTDRDEHGPAARRWGSLVAEEVAELAPHLVHVDELGRPISLHTFGFISLLVERLQRLEAAVSPLPS